MSTQHAGPQMIHGIEILAMTAICRIQVCLHRFRNQVSAMEMRVVMVKGHIV